MTGGDLINLYEISYGAMQRNLAGVSHQEGLLSPNPSGNCMNWVLGHVVATRRLVLALAGMEFAGEELVARYVRGSQPLKPGEAPADLATLRGLLDDSQGQLLAALAAISDERLSAPIPEAWRRPPLTGNIGSALARLNAHENYHAGQIGLLRRLVGKEGAIR
jgi:uncharacterized damage-inducible protein DinB